METAQGQLREWEDAILKAQGEQNLSRSVLADLERQRESQRAELEQLKTRAQEIETDTQAARDRIRELEGEAAALKAEAEGKAQGQSDLQERSLTLTLELSELNAAPPPWRRSGRPPGRAWRSWSPCGRHRRGPGAEPGPHQRL